MMVSLTLLPECDNRYLLAYILYILLPLCKPYYYYALLPLCKSYYCYSYAPYYHYHVYTYPIYCPLHMLYLLIIFQKKKTSTMNLSFF
ncbi:hypothetical protein EDC94DRAFT_609106 [Helicostylum pulchrum]|nr:hypothetical protein EDC94DRAFT_609106 [Helicostylum pulchrum]